MEKITPKGTTPVTPQKITPERLRELLSYDPSTGVIKTKRQRVLTADHDGLVVVFDGISKKSIKMKLERIAYTLAFGVAPKETHRILHKNLDLNDNRLANLQQVSRELFIKIKEAHRNLSTGIKVVAHPTDQFSYNVFWYEQGVEKCKLIQDIGLARRFQVVLQLKYSKILTKYCLFNE